MTPSCYVQKRYPTRLCVRDGTSTRMILEWVPSMKQTDIEICMFLNAFIATISHRWYWQPWASYQIRKVAGCACAGNAGNVFPTRRLQRKPLVSDPGMHHGTCETHVPWCMSGSLTCCGGENVPGIPSACAPAILRIWQEAHGQFWNSCFPGEDIDFVSPAEKSLLFCNELPISDLSRSGIFL